MTLNDENRKRLLIIASISIFLLILYPYLLIPRHPDDDYWFYSVGLSLKSHINLYLTISGRIIVDYISSAILQINNRTLMVALSSAIITLFIYVIATLPFYKQAINYQKLAIISWILFIIIWTTNPALGDTFFWIVGEINYIWPLLVLAVYIKYLLRYLESVKTYKQYSWLVLLAFLCGLSNEASSLMAIYLTACLIGLSIISKHPNTKLLILCLLTAVIGSSILILAPGNFQRAIKEGIEHYNIWQKLSESFSDVMPRILRSYGMIYLIILLFFSYCWRTIRKQDWWIIAILTSSFFTSLLVLGMSPGNDKPRTYITGIFFLWIISSILLKEIISSQRLMTNTQKLLFISYMVFFCISYYYLVVAYNYLNKQENLRIAILDKEKSEKIIHLPSYDRPFSLREGDLPCLFNDLRAEGFMARYFGVSKVIIDDVDFNYIRLLTKQDDYKNYQISTDGKPYIKKIFLQQTLLETKIIIEYTKKIQTIKDNQSAYLMSLTIPSKPATFYFINKPLVIYKIKNTLLSSIAVANILLKDEKYQGHISIEISNRNKQMTLQPIRIMINGYQP